MSDFSSPATDAAAQAREYTTALLAVLGSRDPIAVLRSSPDAFRAAVAGLTDAELARPEAPGKWSALQVLQHLTDSELVIGYRFRLVLTHDRPAIVGYDQDQWVSSLHPGDDDRDRLLTRIAALRLGTVALLAATTPTDRNRVGIHSERGEESLDRMMALFAAHDLVHLRQLARIAGSAGGS